MTTVEEAVEALRAEWQEHTKAAEVHSQAARDHRARAHQLGGALAALDGTDKPAIDQRRKHSDADRRRAVALSRELGVLRASEELGISRSVLYEWRRKYPAEGDR